MKNQVRQKVTLAMLAKAITCQLIEQESCSNTLQMRKVLFQFEKKNCGKF